MAKAVRKISLAACVAQGDTVLTLWCCAEAREPGRLVGYRVPVCGHHADIPIDVFLARYPPETSISDIRGVCTKCGGRYIDVRGQGGVNGPLRRAASGS